MRWCPSTPGPEVLGNFSKSEVIELPTRSHKWTQEENRIVGSVILRVIRLLGAVWRELISCGLREETGR